MSNIKKVTVETKQIQGTFSVLFKRVRKILLEYPQITEIQNKKQTSYHDTYGVILMMRQKGDTFVLAFGKGVKLQEKYPTLCGEGKIVRHWYFKQKDSLNEVQLREMIEESLILSMEAYELKVLKAKRR